MSNVLFSQAVLTFIDESLMQVVEDRVRPLQARLDDLQKYVVNLNQKHEILVTRFESLQAFASAVNQKCNDIMEANERLQTAPVAPQAQIQTDESNYSLGLRVLRLEYLSNLLVQTTDEADPAERDNQLAPWLIDRINTAAEMALDGHTENYLHHTGLSSLAEDLGEKLLDDTDSFTDALEELIDDRLQVHGDGIVGDAIESKVKILLRGASIDIRI